MKLEINCKICEENFNREEAAPLLLPQCGHTLCRRCLQIFLKQIKHKLGSKAIDFCYLVCPFDQKKLKIHQGASIEQFRQNKYLVEFLEREEIERLTALRKKKESSKLFLLLNSKFGEIQKIDSSSLISNHFVLKFQQEISKPSATPNKPSDTLHTYESQQEAKQSFPAKDPFQKEKFHRPH